MVFLLLAYDKMNNIIDSTDIHDEIIEYVCSLQTKGKEKKKKKRKKTFVCAGNPKVKKKKRNRKEVWNFQPRKGRSL